MVDASIALCWCFENEATEATDRLFERLCSEPGAVPSLWPVEIANVLALAERRRRITVAETAAFIALIERLSIVVDDKTSQRAFGPVLDLARSERLTACDAAYLELAMRLGVPLATKDRDLAAAARLGVTVLRAG